MLYQLFNLYGSVELLYDMIYVGTRLQDALLNSTKALICYQCQMTHSSPQGKEFINEQGYQCGRTKRRLGQERTLIVPVTETVN